MTSGMPSGNLLRHVAIIMDGNNRWAKREGRGGIAGHRAGVERIRDVLRTCRELRVEVLTLFAFSSENWRRPPREVDALLTLFQSYLRQEARELAEEGVRLKVVGNRARFSKRLVEAIDRAEGIASHGERTLVIAADYGGQWDLVQAARQLAERVARGELDPNAIDVDMFGSALATSELPPVDLLIRTGGELRISNFLLWQAAYAELYFTDCYWPEFDGAAMRSAAQDYYSRQRRFGLTGEQIRALGSASA